MKRSRFTDSQIVEILKEADAGLPAAAGHEDPATVPVCSVSNSLVARGIS